MEYDPEEYGLQVIECSDPLSTPALPVRPANVGPEFQKL
jgi:hypothetical protein